MTGCTFVTLGRQNTRTHTKTVRSTSRIQHRYLITTTKSKAKAKDNRNKPKAKLKENQSKQIMKLFQMITAALANSSFFQQSNNHEKTKTKTKISSLHDEIAEMLTPPPSIFVSGHTILDSSIPFIHFDVTVAVPSSFDLFSAIVLVPSFTDIRKVIQQQIVPSANQAMQEFQGLKTKAHVLLAAAAQVKKIWSELRTAAAQKLQSWLFDVTLSMVHSSTTKMPRCVWDWMNAVATIAWRCRHAMCQALSLINQPALFNHDDGPVKNRFVAASCSELGTFVLLLLKMTWSLVRQVLKILAYLALRQILDVIAYALRKALPRFDALQLLPIVLAFLLR
jgi:hypothetical protein